MKLMRLADAPIAATDRIYRYGKLRAVFIMTAVVVAAGTMMVLNFPPIAGPILGALMLLMALLFRGHYSARFADTNWLVRTNAEGVFVKFRSFLHHHFSADDVTVLFVPYGRIRAARIVREKTEVPDHEGDPMTETRKWVELDFASAAPELRAAIVEEGRRRAPREQTWYGHSITSYGHFPVRMQSDGALQIEWPVRPAADAFLDELRRYAAIEAPVEDRRDFTKLGTLQKAEQEAKLLELVESGQTVQAVKIARQLYGMGLKESKRFVEELQSR